VTIGRKNDENWEKVSGIGTVSEMWGLKGGNSAVAFYNEPSVQSWKSGNPRAINSKLEARQS